jgi:hypothetical protein
MMASRNFPGEFDVGGYVTVGMRDDDGSVLSALFYTNHLPKIVMNADILSGRSSALKSMIEEKQQDSDYGPYPAAPFGCGLRFFDFTTKTLIDGQSHSDPTGIEFDDIVTSLAEDDGEFERAVPFIVGMTQLKLREDGRLEKESKKIDRVKTMDELWPALGFRGLPGKMDFSTLDVCMPSWKIAVYRRDHPGTQVMQAHLRRLGVCAVGDEAAWREYLDQRRHQGIACPF